MLNFKKTKTQQPVRRTPPPTRRPSTVYSYRASRIEAERKVGRESQVAAMTRRVAGKTSWRLIPSYIAFAAIAVSFIYIILLDTNPKVTVAGALTSKQPLLRKLDAYEAAASQFLRGSITNRTKLTINTSALSLTMQERFPELAQASVVLPLTGHRPIVTITPATPTFVVASQNGVVLIDETGRAMIQVSEVPNLASLKLMTITDQSTISVEPGKAVLPARDVVFMRQLGAQFDSAKLSIESLTLPALARELHVRVQGRPFFIKFNLDGAVEQQSGALFAVLEKLKSENVTPAEYIDVRVEEKVFYK